MKIYLFNVTNSENWLKGVDDKIKVQQVGPFVYKEHWTKTNITFHRSVLFVVYPERLPSSETARSTFERERERDVKEHGICL